MRQCDILFDAPILPLVDQKFTNKLKMSQPKSLDITHILTVQNVMKQILSPVIQLSAKYVAF